MAETKGSTLIVLAIIGTIEFIITELIRASAGQDTPEPTPAEDLPRLTGPYGPDTFTTHGGPASQDVVAACEAAQAGDANLAFGRLHEAATRLESKTGGSLVLAARHLYNVAPRLACEAMAHVKGRFTVTDAEATT